MPHCKHAVSTILYRAIILMALAALTGCGSRLETTILSESLPPEQPVTEAAEPEAQEARLPSEPVTEAEMAIEAEEPKGIPPIDIPVEPPPRAFLREGPPPTVSPAEQAPEVVPSQEERVTPQPIPEPRTEAKELAQGIPPVAIEPELPPQPSLPAEEAPVPAPAPTPEAAPPTVSEPVEEMPVAPPTPRQEFARAIPPAEIEPELPPQPSLPAEEAPVPAPAPQTPIPREEAKGVPPSVAPSAPIISEKEITEVSAPLRDIFFDYDQFIIRNDAVPTLTANAKLLLNHYADRTIVIEGHCDERGTQAYNLVLGKRRAQAVKDYLVDLGVPRERLQIVSFGKEKPFCTEHSLECWQENRRAHFVLQ